MSNTACNTAAPGCEQQIYTDLIEEDVYENPEEMKRYVEPQQRGKPNTPNQNTHGKVSQPKLPSQPTTRQQPPAKLDIEEKPKSNKTGVRSKLKFVLGLVFGIICVLGFGFSLGYFVSNSGWVTRARCGSLADIPGGLVTTTGHSYGDLAIYSCLDGRVMTGNKLQICQENDKWSGSVPACTVVECRNLSTSSGGQISITRTTYGGIATFSCPAGRTLRGSKTRTCLSTGEWSGTESCCIVPGNSQIKLVHERWMTKSAGSCVIGRLLVYHSSEWGTVCNDGFGAAEATVACKQLGYSSGYNRNSLGITVPTVEQVIWLDDVDCTGEEASIFECSHDTWGTNDCTHLEDVILECTHD